MVERLVLMPTRWRLVGLLLLAILMTAGGAWMAIDPAAFLGPSWLTLVVGWNAMIFFGLGAVAMSWQVVFSRPVLVAGAVGIEFGRDRVPWAEVTEIGMTRVLLQRFLRFSLRDPESFVLRQAAVLRPAARWSLRLAGSPVIFPATFLPGRLEQVRDTIEAYRNRVAPSA